MKPRRGKMLKCQGCGAEFYVQPSGVGRKFCSRECSWASFVSKKKRRCRECGKEYEVHPSQIKHRKSKFCSASCQYAHQGRKQTGASNTFYRGNKIAVTRLDGYFSLYVRLRDDRTCQRCGTVYPRGSHGLDCSHFIGRANRATRWEPDNCLALCRGCHSYMETHKATLYRDWMIERLGQERFDALVVRSRETKVDKDAIGEQVRELVRGVNDGRLYPTVR